MKVIAEQFVYNNKATLIYCKTIVSANLLQIIMNNKLIGDCDWYYNHSKIGVFVLYVAKLIRSGM